MASGKDRRYGNNEYDVFLIKLMLFKKICSKKIVILNNYISKMEESENTGVIYVITNTVNDKKYIGKAVSFVGEKKSKYGANGRFKKHIYASKHTNDCPLLYNDIRIHGKDNFKVEVLEVCLKDDLKAKETHYITEMQTYKNDIGYNFFIGDNKPQDAERKKEYEDNKVESNKKRCEGGKMRQSETTVSLPPNVYKRSAGFFAQIKINSNLYNKAFLSSKETDEEKLEKARLWLEQTKIEHA
jgi:group I intron endonuclease